MTKKKMMLENAFAWCDSLLGFGFILFIFPFMGSYTGKRVMFKVNFYLETMLKIFYLRQQFGSIFYILH